MELGRMILRTIALDLVRLGKYQHFNLCYILIPHINLRRKHCYMKVGLSMTDIGIEGLPARNFRPPSVSLT